MRKAQLSLFLILQLMLGAVSAEPDVTITDPAIWLAKMAHATSSLNYEGRFVYQQGNKLDALRIIHRVDDKGEHERLQSLDGEAIEVIRFNGEISHLENGELVEQGPASAKGLFPAALLRPGRRLEKNYKMTVTGMDRVAGRSTCILNITPVDQFRYGYQLWIDEETGLLLKSQLHLKPEQPVEQILYTEVTINDTIADEKMEPAKSASGYTWLEPADIARSSDIPGQSMVDIQWLPAGFKQDSYKAGQSQDDSSSIEHTTYTDGLASFSVFVERIVSDKEYLHGPSSMGAMNAFGRKIGNLHVLLVGDVPADTVRKVADGTRKSAQ